MSIGTENTGLAFGLVIMAGLSTAIGAAAVYFKPLVKLANHPILACGLGFSAGVMIYVSFVEIFVKSNEAFAAMEGWEEKSAYIATTGCTFAGMAFMKLLSFIVHKLSGGHDHCIPDSFPQAPPALVEQPGATPPGQLQVDANQVQVNVNADAEQANGQAAKDAKDKTDVPLMMMGVNTAAAIGIHNFPEGLATFVATLVDPAVGATLAIAIAIHNIPEGLCVALPIYYATGNKHKGFLYALWSGLSEPIGALIGYLIIKSTGDDMNQLVYGLLFGLVAGMMIMIVIMELIPTAHKYDPKDKVTSNSVVAGMFVMALSLVLFQF